MLRSKAPYLRPGAARRVPPGEYNDTMTVMRFEAGGRRFQADFASPRSIAIPLDFAGPQPVFFGAPPATARPCFDGASVRCDSLSLVPHCNGTHTECLGHVTEDRIAVSEVLPGGAHVALLVSVEPASAAQSQEDSDPRPAAGDMLITARALEQAAARHSGPAPRALIVRTSHAGEEPARAYRGPAPAPYLSRQAADWLVAAGIEHLVLDLPSADRAEDGGRLTAHRILFGLPAGSRRAADAIRPQATITEFAWIPAGIADGHYLLDIQIPAFVADAAPSRPLLYALRSE
jgi:arylformamidase